MGLQHKIDTSDEDEDATYEEINDADLKSSSDIESDMPDDVQEQGISVVREAIEKDELYTDSSPSESSEIKDAAPDAGKTTSEEYSEVPKGR